MIKTATTILSAFTALALFFPLNTAYAFDHSKMTNLCKAKIEQDNNLSGFKTVRHRIKGVKGLGDIRQYRIRTYLTTNDGQESVMMCKCKINSSGKILALEMISS